MPRAAACSTVSSEASGHLWVQSLRSRCGPCPPLPSALPRTGTCTASLKHQPYQPSLKSTQPHKDRYKDVHHFKQRRPPKSQLSPQSRGPTLVEAQTPDLRPPGDPGPLLALPLGRTCPPLSPAALPPSSVTAGGYRVATGTSPGTHLSPTLSSSSSSFLRDSWGLLSGHGNISGEPEGWVTRGRGAIATRSG